MKWHHASCKQAHSDEDRGNKRNRGKKKRKENMSKKKSKKQRGGFGSWRRKNNMMKQQQSEHSEGREGEEEGACGCVMYNKLPLAECWPFSHDHPSVSSSPLFPLRPWNTPLLLPHYPCTPVTFPVFSIIIPFSISIFHSPSSQLFSLHTGFTLYTLLHRNVYYWIIVYPCFTLYSICHRPFVIWYSHIQQCVWLLYSLTGHLCACSLGITYFLCRLKTQSWDGLKHIRWSSASCWHDLFSPSDKGKPITR